ncbi:DUF2628 domain-containing protein [Rickettsiales endosymbiont of Peranema trichophorum]|uniref:DUF2628 domain-containing protein n=1 Tax=Rickettsiales endosymbiont of Peranema trichophorum TaxID=2486577 RepID=UPI0010230A6A|nr:DUF2628 domain-containing protein [Rickettsiales endosymbiont of Peranema trichophorum]RZI47782.1 DUF2628 domain-containing protein [Rickettsiales endosymbiont of Peranema trichophorum]
MKVVTFFSKGQGDSFEKMLEVPEDFSLVAMFFGPLWMLYHRMWKQLLCFLVLLLVINSLGLCNRSASIFAVMLSLYIGLSAHTWLQQKYLRMGYKLKDVVVAKTLDEARLKFLTNNNLV